MNYFETGIKNCIYCKKQLPISCFYFRSDKPHLLASGCSGCVKNKSKIYVLKNIEKKKKRDKLYHHNNKEKRIQYLKQWRKDNKEKIRTLFNEKYKSDLDFRLSQNIRNRIRIAIKRNSKKSTSEELLGCSIPELKVYISSLFTEGMSWENYGKWQIDHIKPCSKFDLSNDLEQKMCFNYKNLQPLWAMDNLLKRDKYKEKEVRHR